MKYIYLDKEQAKKGISMVYEVRDEKRLNFKSYFENKAIEYRGEDLPHFITYINDINTVRESTEEEKLKRGQRKLANYEILLDDIITRYDPITQKVENNKIIDKKREDYIAEEIITFESEKKKARDSRTTAFKVLDLYDKAVLRGDIGETPEMKNKRDIFRKAWLQLPNKYKNISKDIESLYPITPDFIEKFI